MRKFAGVTAAAAAIFAIAAAPAGAGQPNADCENDVPSTVYAGADANPATNPHAVSQYDVACVSGRTR
jgi:hypothetical protein